MKRVIAAMVLLALSGCVPQAQLPAGVLNSGNCEVAGTASIPGAVNLSFQCAASLSQQGPPAAASAMRAAVAPTPQPWPIPPAPPPLPPLPSP